MLPLILERVKAAGYVVFTGPDYDLNLIGVRSSNKITNVFDDKFYIVYKENNEWVELVYPCTTDPGTYWIKNPSRVQGTAILKAGQYRGAYHIGLHKGRYRALTQIKPVTVWRDNNRDMTIDQDKTQTGLFGINIHRTSSISETDGSISQNVNKWSAGCTVIPNKDHFDNLINLCDMQIQKNNWHTFTYTLLED